MKNESFPPIDPYAKLIQSPVKNAATQPHSVSATPSPSKVPQNAKIVSNYLLGIFLEIQAKTSDRALSEKCISLSTYLQVRKWQSK